MSIRAPLLIGLAFLLLGSVGCTVYDTPHGAYGPHVTTEVRVDLFYDSLSPYGDWILLDAHGWVWIPYGVSAGWRPYTVGRWLYTSAGWTWYSSWDWGWAPFHYGRWLRHGHHGWVWVPGRVWGPGWVAWRTGGEWMGWAPLPPQVGWRAGVGFDLHGLDLNVGISAETWSFIHTSRLIENGLHNHLAPTHRNMALLRTTRDITHYREHDRSVVESGVTVERVERALGRAVSRYRVEELAAPPGSHVGNLDRRALRIYRPRIKEATPGIVPPRSKGKGRSGG